MKRTLKVPFLASLHHAYTVGGFVLGAVALLGCPVYSNSSGSSGEITCDSQGNCCDMTGNCAVWNCDYSEQCPGTASCSVDGFCVGESTDGGFGYDSGYYDSGYYEDAGSDATVSCPEVPCDPGYQCVLTNGTAQCLPVVDASVHDGGNDPGRTPRSTRRPATRKPATRTPTRPLRRTTAPWVTAGSTPPTRTRSRRSPAAPTTTPASPTPERGRVASTASASRQPTSAPTRPSARSSARPRSNAYRVSARPSCANGALCPTGYACNTSGLNGVCTVNPTPCGAALDAGSCTGGTTCVDGHCVPQCATPAADAAVSGRRALRAGDRPLALCIDNGCIPDTRPAVRLRQRRGRGRCSGHLRGRQHLPAPQLLHHMYARRCRGNAPRT